MTVRVDVSPAMLRWARARSGIDVEVWEKRFSKYDSWMSGEMRPTLKQLQDFAHGTYTPVGFFFLEEPPDEKLTIPDFRTVRDHPVTGPGGNLSGDLLDTVYVCQARQEWYRENQLLNGEAPLEFVGSVTLDSDPSDAAEQMRLVLDWTPATRERPALPAAVLTRLRENAEAAGVLVLISGIVGSNTRRKLDPEEFRGFALADSHAALVFVNGADSKAAQVFTLAHELAHLWLGETALSDVNPESTRTYKQERWCNQAAAELLVPMDEFRAVFDSARDLRTQLQPLALCFGVSTQVILGRVHEAGALSWGQFMAELAAEKARVAEFVTERGTERGRGGNYYKTKPVQVSKRFARELIVSTLEGRTTYTEAFRLLDVKKTTTFERLGNELGVL